MRIEVALLTPTFMDGPSEGVPGTSAAVIDIRLPTLVPTLLVALTLTLYDNQLLGQC